MSAKRPTPPAVAHPWEFKARFRRHAFGWKSQPAITRVKQAVAEVKKVAKKDPAVAAEGASSLGAIGTAVSNAIAELRPLLALRR